MDNSKGTGSGWGWTGVALVVVVALVGLGWLYQREGGSLFGRKEAPPTVKNPSSQPTSPLPDIAKDRPSQDVFAHVVSPPHPGPCRGACYSPNGRYIARWGGGLGVTDAEIYVRTVLAGDEVFRERFQYEHDLKDLFRQTNFIIKMAVFSPESQILAALVVRSQTSGGTNKIEYRPEVILWHVPSGKEFARLSDHSYLTDANEEEGSIALSTEARFLAWSWRKAGQRTINLWDLKDRRIARSIEGLSQLSPDARYSMDFSPEGDRLAAITCTDKADEIRVFSVTNGNELLRLPGSRCVAFSPDGNRLATTIHKDGRSSGLIYATTTGKQLLSCKLIYDIPASSVAFSPDGKYIVFAPDLDAPTERVATVFDAQTGKEVFALKTRDLVKNWNETYTNPTFLSFTPDSHNVYGGYGLYGPYAIWKWALDPPK